MNDMYNTEIYLLYKQEDLLREAGQKRLVQQALRVQSEKTRVLAEQKNIHVEVEFSGSRQPVYRRIIIKRELT